MRLPSVSSLIQQCNSICQSSKLLGDPDLRRYYGGYREKYIRMRDSIITRYVHPIYRNVLHGNFLTKRRDVERESFVNSTKIALYEVTEQELCQMYNAGWREAITASWLCGIGRFSEYFNTIESLLIPSKTCYAGQLHCFALARFETAESVRVLRLYLNTYLPIGIREYDQKWAIAALQWLDLKNGTDYAKVYLENPDNWKVKYLDREIEVKQPERIIPIFYKMMEFTDQHFPEFAL